jgi:hypothetical protein
MAFGEQKESPDAARAAKSRQLGQCTSIHKVDSVLRIVGIAAAVLTGMTAFAILVTWIRVNNVMTSLGLCGGLMVLAVFLVAGFMHRGEEVYLYTDGLVFVDRTSVTAIRFDEIQLLERITRKSSEATLGRISYRIAGGGYSIRVSGLVRNSRELGQRLEDAVRQHGGWIR